ncbi:MAG: hypothetical protein FJZ92_10045 [Chloroflexi bacterium]|nr:hypothetical protein [Chloroflexota bacterium]
MVAVQCMACQAVVQAAIASAATAHSCAALGTAFERACAGPVGLPPNLCSLAGRELERLCSRCGLPWIRANSGRGGDRVVPRRRRCVGRETPDADDGAGEIKRSSDRLLASSPRATSTAWSASYIACMAGLNAACAAAGAAVAALMVATLPEDAAFVPVVALSFGVSETAAAAVIAAITAGGATTIEMVFEALCEHRGPS